jgi:FkbM family methyltransferase
MPGGVIYDVGSNNGDDIPYYLKKAGRVVAVEANPVLCAGIRDRFATEIASGALILVEGAAIADAEDRDVIFGVHTSNAVLSSLSFDDDPSHFKQLTVRGYSLAGLITRHGAPIYVKIDVEGLDYPLVKSLFDHGIFPRYISAEAHEPLVAALLMAQPCYTAFNIVEGASVARVYSDATIATEGGAEAVHSFPHHSAGPFGEDLTSPWLSRGDFLRRIGVTGCGWKDIHATSELQPSEHGYRLRDMTQDAMTRIASQSRKKVAAYVRKTIVR